MRFESPRPSIVQTQTVGLLLRWPDIGFTRLEAIGSDVIIVDDAHLHFPRWRNDTTQAAIVFHSAFHREMLNVTRLDDRFSFSLCSVLSFFLLFLYFFFFFPLFPGWESMRIITDNNDHKSADVIRDTHFFILSWNISSYFDFPFFKSVIRVAFDFASGSRF